jgi:hypothetical protein
MSGRVAGVVLLLMILSSPGEAGLFGGKKKLPEAERLILRGETTRYGPAKHPSKYQQPDWGKRREIHPKPRPLLHSVTPS